MTKTLRFIPEKCTACHQCELACSGINEGVFSPERSRIRIYQYSNGPANIPHACHQCDDAWCLFSCPVGAITKNESDGVKALDRNLCVGCKVCTISCPYGKIIYISDTGKAIKCDLCGGDPVCIPSCAPGAIELVERP